jgi:hypothetical protein
MALRRANPSYPLIYNVCFLYIEPLSIFVGGFIAMFLPSTYLETVHATSTSAFSGEHQNSPGTQVLLAQWANIYVLFALNEALVFWLTSSHGVWRTMLAVFLLVDFGHLCIVFGFGSDVR